MKTRRVLGPFGLLAGALLAACSGQVLLNEVDGGGTAMRDAGGNPGEDAVTVSGDAATEVRPPSCPARPGGVGAAISALYRFLPDGTPYSFRQANEDPSGIDTADCVADAYLEITAVLCGLPTVDTFQAWVGTTDCTLSTAREVGTGGPRCWPVVPVGAIGVSQTSTFKVRAQDIVAYLGSANPPTTYTRAGASACERLSSLTCRAPLNLYIIGVSPDGLTGDGASSPEDVNAVNTPSSSGACPPTDVPAPACKLAFYPAGYPSQCQEANDAACCAQEQACAANADCVNAVDCINACPPPRQDSCVNACAPDGGIPASLTALSACTKGEPPVAGVASGACDWPN